MRKTMKRYMNVLWFMAVVSLGVANTVESRVRKVQPTTPTTQEESADKDQVPEGAKGQPVVIRLGDQAAAGL